MKSSSIVLVGAAAVFGVACSSWVAGVPKEMRGHTPMRVTNWTDTPVCTFGLTPTNKPVNHNADWLGKLGKLQPGETREYNMKPGSYTMSLHACKNKFSAEQPIEINGAFVVSIGAPEQQPQDGYRLVLANTVGKYGAYVAPVYVQSGGGESGGGGEASGGEQGGGEESGEAPAAQAQGPACKPNGTEVSSSSDCCSGYTEAHGMLHNGGHNFCCGPSLQDCHNTE
jgi:hypothetical protein